MGFENMMEIDDYENWILDNVDEPLQKTYIKLMRTLTRNFDAQTFVNIKDPRYTFYLDKLLEIGFITEDKYNEMLEPEYL